MLHRIRSRKKHHSEKGFSLIELMIAIAAIGLLTAIALPEFTKFMGRARVAEALTYAQGCKNGYLEYYATNSRLPVTNDDANCPSITTDNVARVEITSGTGAQNASAIRVYLPTVPPFPEELWNHVLVLQPLDPADAMIVRGQRIESWRCSLLDANGAQASDNAREFVPSICRNMVISG